MTDGNDFHDFYVAFQPRTDTRTDKVTSALIEAIYEAPRFKYSRETGEVELVLLPDMTDAEQEIWLDHLPVNISWLTRSLQKGEVELDLMDREQQGQQQRFKQLRFLISLAEKLRTELQAELKRVQQHAEPNKPESKPPVDGETQGVMESVDAGGTSFKQSQSVGDEERAVPAIATTNPLDALVTTDEPVIAGPDVPVIAGPNVPVIADPMQDNPVLMLGIVGIIVHLIIHFAYVLMYVLGDANEEEESLLSDASIERHRRLFEQQAQRERQQHRQGNTVVLDTLNQILWDNRHQPLSLRARIKELHARLIENGTLPKLPKANHID